MIFTQILLVLVSTAPTAVVEDCLVNIDNNKTTFGTKFIRDNNHLLVEHRQINGYHSLFSLLFCDEDNMLT